MNLDEKIFGNIMIREIIGETPDDSETQKRLEQELEILLKKLDGKKVEELNSDLQQQDRCFRVVNSRPGAMALAQNKIRLFNEYNNKYREEINKRLA